MRKEVAQHEARRKEAKERAAMMEPDRAKPQAKEKATKPWSGKLERPGWGKSCLMTGRCARKHPPEHCTIFRSLKPNVRLAVAKARGLCDRCMTKVRTKERWNEIMRCGIASCGTARPWRASKRRDDQYPPSKRKGDGQGAKPRQDIWAPDNRGSGCLLYTSPSPRDS